MKTEAKPFVVIGDSRFPLDMLRYDSCYPINTDAVHEIERSLEPEKDGSQYFVTLVHNGDKAWRPTVDRWRSYGWRVLWGAEAEAFR